MYFLYIIFLLHLWVLARFRKMQTSVISSETTIFSGLMAIHVVFLRLHNRLARNMAHLNPEWSDERIYQETRKIIGAILQHITYREFLPIVLGKCASLAWLSPT